MLNEVKFSTYVDTNTYVEDIDLNEFIKRETTEQNAFQRSIVLCQFSLHQSSTGLWFEPCRSPSSVRCSLPCDRLRLNCDTVARGLWSHCGAQLRTNCGASVHSCATILPMRTVDHSVRREFQHLQYAHISHYDFLSATSTWIESDRKWVLYVHVHADLIIFIWCCLREYKKVEKNRLMDKNKRKQFKKKSRILPRCYSDTISSCSVQFLDLPIECSALPQRNRMQSWPEFLHLIWLTMELAPRGT